MKTEDERIKLNFDIQLKKYFEDLCVSDYEFKDLYEKKDKYKNSIEATLDYDLFYEDYIKNNSKLDINQQNIKEYFGISKILDLHSLTIIKNLQIEIDDFLNENRFLTQTMNLKDDINSISSKKLIEDITVNQISKCIYLYNKSMNQLTEVWRKISSLNDDLKLEKHDIQISLKRLKDNYGFLNLKMNIFNILPQRYKIPEYIVEFKKLLEKEKMCINKQTTMSNKMDLILNDMINDNRFLKEYSSNFKEINKEIRLITKNNKPFQDKISQFENEKKFAHELSDYDPELSDIFNEAVGNKTDYIMKNLNNSLKIFKDGLLNYEDTLLTKTSQAMVKIHPMLRVKDIEGKTLPEYLKSMAIKIGIKKTVVFAMGLLAFTVNNSLHITDNIDKYSMSNHNQVKEILTSIKDKNAINVDLTKIKNFDDIYKVVNNLNFDNLDVQKCFEISKITSKNETAYEINKQSKILEI